MAGLLQTGTISRYNTAESHSLMHYSQLCGTHQPRRQPEVVALPDIKATTIARGIFDNWICRYGVMERLHSDGANNVDGHVMQQVSELLGIIKSKSSRLHPQGDGLSEAVVKLVKSII